MMISLGYLIFLSLILPLPSLSTQQASSCNHGAFPGSVLRDIKPMITNVSSLHDTISSVATRTPSPKRSTKFRSSKTHTKGHLRLHLRNVHGILNVIGWGTLLPTGAIAARFFRESPLKCDEWYIFHICCQTSGYVLGATGWAIGLSLGNSSKLNTFKTHGILGIIIFTLSTLQVLALCLQPKMEGAYRRYWEIYHKLVGYALIAMIIANIFQGIHNVKGHAHEKWKWTYVSILVVLASVAVSLEILRWIKPRLQQHNVAFHSNT